MKDNKERSRYEYDAGGGHYGVVGYRRLGDGNIVLLHTEVPEELEGQGVGSRMIKAILEYVSSQGCKVLPQCPFASSYISRHPEWKSILINED